MVPRFSSEKKKKKKKGKEKKWGVYVGSFANMRFTVSGKKHHWHTGPSMNGIEIEGWAKLFPYILISIEYLLP